MTIGIRCDANDEIAMGHLMRCMTIAEQLQEMGERVLFFISDASAASTLLEKNIPYICLQNDYRKKDEELPILLTSCDEQEIACLLVDSYEVTSHYLEQLHSRMSVAYIDDINAMHYPVDLLINYTVDADRNDYNGRGDYRGTKFLLGSRYIPIRKEFAENRRDSVNYPLTSLFLTSGGTDPYGMIRKLITEWNSIPRLQQMKKYVVVGKYYDRIEALQQCASQYGNIEIYQNIPDIWNVMKKADIAVTAGGTTVAELCAMGKPMVAFAMADNQLPGLHAYESLGALEYAGDVRADDKRVIQNISNSIKRMCEEESYAVSLMQKANSIVDGRGAQRIAQELIAVCTKEMRG